jgi:GNAT superfamily N-acetyltransferase
MMEIGKFLIALNGNGNIVASVYVEVRSTRGSLGMLALDPAEQGEGRRRAMVRAAEDYCRTKACSVLDLLVINLRTDLPPFYRRLAYQEVGTEEFHPSRTLKTGVECYCIVM